MSQDEIAKRLNISPVQVSRLQQRALKRLREMLIDDLSPREAEARVVNRLIDKQETDDQEEISEEQAAESLATIDDMNASLQRTVNRLDHMHELMQEMIRDLREARDADRE
jgi:transcriptional regulator with XRE-family HTH domain